MTYCKVQWLLKHLNHNLNVASCSLRIRSATASSNVTAPIVGQTPCTSLANYMTTYSPWCHLPYLSSSTHNDASNSKGANITNSKLNNISIHWIPNYFHLSALPILAKKILFSLDSRFFGGIFLKCIGNGGTRVYMYTTRGFRRLCGWERI